MADRIPAACKSETLRSRMAASESFGEAVQIMTSTLMECLATTEAVKRGETSAPDPVVLNAIAEDSNSYVCCFTKDRPWAEYYDARQDGFIGWDDVRAMFTGESDAYSDESSEVRALECEKAKVTLVKEEMEWKLKGLLAGLSDRPAAPEAEVAVRQTETIEADALRRVDHHAERVRHYSREWQRRMGLMESDHPFLSVQDARSQIVEMGLRARGIVRGADKESFGVGIKLVPQPFGRGFPLEIREIHEASVAAAAGIRRGDRLIAIGNQPVEFLSTDFTIDGLYDPETGMIRGLGGPRHSTVYLTVYRPGEGEKLVRLERNIWSARTLGTASGRPFYTGTEQAPPGTKPR